MIASPVTVVLAVLAVSSSQSEQEVAHKMAVNNDVSLRPSKGTDCRPQKKDFSDWPERTIMTNQERNEAEASELNHRGYELAEAGRWEEAVAFYQEALRLNPRNLHSLTNMGNALQALGHLSEALTYQDKALAAGPDNALAWANKAVILSGLNRRAEAIHCYDRSLELDPSNKVTWFNKGVALFLIGKESEAIQCLDHILENIDSRMKNALGAKAEILKADGRTNEAAKCLERMKEIDAEGEPFSFASAQVSINLFGSEVDARKMLRGFEAVLRQRSGLPQIAADFMPPGGPSGRRALSIRTAEAIAFVCPPS